MAPHNFLPCERDQEYLMPVSLRDWLSEDELAWFVIDAVGEMDLELSQRLPRGRAGRRTTRG